MASHAQINQNVADVQSAWGQLQTLFHYNLPGVVNQLVTLNRIVQRRKRYA